MPEIVTKHPEEVVKVLKGANMSCGEDIAAKEVPGCPSEQLCSIQGGSGEICVYSPTDVSSMTQMSSLDFIKNSPDLILPTVSLAAVLFLTGVLTGIALKRYVR